jgi:glutamine---fructose-6-phosphate transaminase (isomerizing)
MASSATGIQDELHASADVVRRQATLLVDPIAALVRHIGACRPSLVVTCARGSSAHAAKFAKHLIERHLGIPVAAAAPNIATQYRRSLNLQGQLFLSISQSGRSDDLIEMTTMARDAGALTTALVNDSDSPLARASELVLPLCAGTEMSVAATKSFVASLAALLRIIAAWTLDLPLGEACRRLPDRLAAAAALDWGEALGLLTPANSVVTIGRGPTLAIAHEAALKLKETCELHAEAFSAAEFRHGPIALVSPAYPVVVFSPNDETAAGFSDLVADLRRKGARVLVAEPGGSQTGRLPTLGPDHPDADAICLIQSFYGLLVGLAERRGTNADQPRHLRKVTRTK